MVEDAISRWRVQNKLSKYTTPTVVFASKGFFEFHGPNPFPPLQLSGALIVLDPTLSGNCCLVKNGTPKVDWKPTLDRKHA
jgi:hypothetical protein